MTEHEFLKRVDKTLLGCVFVSSSLLLSLSPPFPLTHIHTMKESKCQIKNKSIKMCVLGLESNILRGKGTNRKRS